MRHLALLCFASGAVAHAQLSATVSLDNGLQFQVTSNLGHPTGEQTLDVEMARASGDSFYRIFRDQNKLAVFAYELEVALAPGGNALRATAKPVMTEFAARYPNADAGKPVPTLSSDHVLGPIGSGQSADLGLFEIPGMGLQVSETIRARFGDGGKGALRFAGLRVSIDNKLIAGPPAPGAVSGRYVMFYIPGQGGYFFSIEPGRGFIKAGTIDKTRMQFTIENRNYDCLTTVPILTQSDGGEVWVFHDPAFQPAGNWTQEKNTTSPSFYTAAADSLGWWLP